MNFRSFATSSLVKHFPFLSQIIKITATASRSFFAPIVSFIFLNKRLGLLKQFSGRLKNACQVYQAARILIQLAPEVQRTLFSQTGRNLPPLLQHQSANLETCLIRSSKELHFYAVRCWSFWTVPTHICNLNNVATAKPISTHVPVASLPSSNSDSRSSWPSYK